MNSVLVADSIGKRFGSRRILTAATLQARSGEVTLLAGSNGAGKSTLLRIAAGLTAPDHGTIRFRNRLVMRARLGRLAREGLFFLPDRDILSRAFTIRSNLEAVRARFSGKSIDEVAEQLGIASLLDLRADEVSGGEKRRAELALALTRRPICLLCDEPLRGIDPKDRAVLVEALRRAAADGSAVVVSGHEMADLLEASDAVVWVTSGTTYRFYTPGEALTSERFRREYLTGRWEA